MKKMLKKLFKNFLAIFMMRSNSYILRKMKYKDIISFDVFDTLICRDVSAPEKIFDYVGMICEEKLGISKDQYVEKRIFAECTARRMCLSEEVTLSEIYQCFTINGDYKRRLMRMEMEVEYEHCHRNQTGYELYNKANSAGKNIIITSDMYLDKQFMISILKKCGYEYYSNIYLSSEIGMKKKTGNLFKYLLMDLNVPGNTILHIGDNPVSDGMAAFFCGITCSIIK